MAHHTTSFYYDSPDRGAIRVWTFVDNNKWSPDREIKIQGYLEISEGLEMVLGTLSMGNFTVYTFFPKDY